MSTVLVHSAMRRVRPLPRRGRSGEEQPEERSSGPSKIIGHKVVLSLDASRRSGEGHSHLQCARAAIFRRCSTSNDVLEATSPSVARSS